MRSELVLAVGLGFVIDCGCASQGGTGDAGGMGGATPSGGGDSGSGGDGGGTSPTGCPATLPAFGGPCAGELLCSYGDAPRAQCRSRASCTLGAWVIATPTNCPAPPMTGCPA